MSDQDRTEQDDGQHDGQGQDDGIFRFSILVDGRRVNYAFDPDADQFRGDEAALVERHAGRVLDWWHRIEQGANQASAVDLLLIVFIAAGRAQVAEHGSSQLVWEEFIASVAPFTLRPESAPEPVPANRGTRRTATPKTAPRKAPARKAGPKAVTESAATG